MAGGVQLELTPFVGAVVESILEGTKIRAMARIRWSAPWQPDVDIEPAVSLRSDGPPSRKPQIGTDRDGAKSDAQHDMASALL